MRQEDYSESNKEDGETLGPYAFVSHESAVEAIWALAARNWQEVLDDESVWLIPKAELCVTTQGDFKRLAKSVDLHALGIRRLPVDLLVPDKSCYSRGKLAKFHVWNDYFPPRSFVRVHDRVFVSTPYFAALQLAMARRPGHAQVQAAQDYAEEDDRARTMLGIANETATASELLRWESIASFVRATQVLTDFMGTYRFVPVDSSDTYSIDYGKKPLITPKALEEYLAKMGPARGIKRARKVAATAFAGAASPMETMLALLLSLPKSLGGFGLPRPELNWEVPIAFADQGFASQDRIIVDLCWPGKRVAVEYYGWDEHFGAGPHKVASDMARANSLTALGWKVIHVTYEQLRSLAGATTLARQIARVLEVELPEPSNIELIWRARLLAMLLPQERM